MFYFLKLEWKKNGKDLKNYRVGQTVTQYDRLLASYCCLSVCPSVYPAVGLMQCVVELRVGVEG